jgi:hypothetical protein
LRSFSKVDICRVFRVRLSDDAIIALLADAFRFESPAERKVSWPRGKRCNSERGTNPSKKAAGKRERQDEVLVHVKISR